jgi:Trypsin-like peptidase domain
MTLRYFCVAKITLLVFACSLAAAPQLRKTQLGVGQLPVGFGVADADSNGSISLMELTDYLSARLKDLDIPFEEIFDGIDTDGDKKLSEPEFDKRHKVLEEVLGPDWMGTQGLGFTLPPDPGANYVLFSGLDRPMDDLKIYSAVHHRYLEQLAEPEASWTTAGWKQIELDKVPTSTKVALPIAKRKLTTDALFRATLVMVGGGSTEQMSIGGAVIVSPDGLAVTNFHIANLFNEKIIGLLSDGRVVRVTKFLAGDPLTDVAIVQLDKRDLPWVPVAQATPEMAESILMVHHTENRFYTYDRGYIKRYPMIGTKPWMEISADFAPGGSGCGIFNSNHELVGLVSMIMMGDGPTIASQDLLMPPEDAMEGETEDFAAPDGAMVVVKLAVPLTAIRELCK